MKKVLYITINGIYDRGGGPLAQRRIYDALKTITKSKNALLKVVSLDKNIECGLGIDINKNRKKDILSRMLCHSNYFYIEWLKYKKDIMEFNPDIILLGTSRLGFIAKELKNKNIKVITHLENIEVDYVDAYFANKKSIKSRIAKCWEKIAVFRDEKNSMFYSDSLIFLTERDKDRSDEVYKNVCKNRFVLPICIEDIEELNKKSDNKNLVFLGSLNYGSNLDAIMWFIKSVWSKYYINTLNFKLIIAGSNPSEELINEVKSYENIQLYRDFSSKSEIVPINSLFIAPIRIGAGMKVKIAEALSMGIIVVASKEALTGYEEAINDSISRNNIFEANEPEEYKNVIDRYLLIEADEFEDVRQKSIEIFKKYYSYERSRNTISNIIK